MEPNPYESPQVAQAATANAEPKVPETFLAWERLRIWYNAVLVVAVLLGSIPAPQWILSLEFIMNVPQGVILVNLAFSIGMLVEFYLLWFGWWRNWMRTGLFVVGAALSFFVTLSVTLVMATGGV
jgi:hypothetical protein